MGTACDFDPRPLIPTPDSGGEDRQDGGPTVEPSDGGGFFEPDAENEGPPDVGMPSDAGVVLDAGVDPNVVCGDGIIESPETCDDQNVDARDGCSSACSVEPEWSCRGEPSECVLLPPRISVIGASASEGQVLPFRFALSRPVDVDVTVDWSTVNGTAVAPFDYTGGFGTATLPAGETEAILNVATIYDIFLEPTETMFVTLATATQALIDIGTATGTIAGPRLVDRGLLARYFLDEQNSGLPSKPVRDVHENPVDLMINLDERGPAYLVSPSGRGLRWTSVASDGWVGAPVDDTRFEELDDSETMTIELLVDVQEVGSSSRLIHLGGQNDDGAFSLVVSANAIQLARRGAFPLTWNVSLRNRGPVAVTITYNSEPRFSGSRLHLYFDGSPIDVINDPAQPRREQIHINNNDWFTIGNRRDGGRALVGTISYVAVYDEELMPNEVRDNAHAIRAWDDEVLP